MEMVNPAWPPLIGTGPPRLVPSTWNCTVPVGEAPVTVAWKLADWPTTSPAPPPFSMSVVVVGERLAKASSAAPTRPSKAAAKTHVKRTVKIRFRIADNPQLNCLPHQPPKRCRCNCVSASDSPSARSCPQPRRDFHCRQSTSARFPCNVCHLCHSPNLWTDPAVASLPLVAKS